MKKDELYYRLINLLASVIIGLKLLLYFKNSLPTFINSSTILIGLSVLFFINYGVEQKFSSKNILRVRVKKDAFYKKLFYVALFILGVYLFLYLTKMDHDFEQMILIQLISTLMILLFFSAIMPEDALNQKKEKD